MKWFISSEPTELEQWAISDIYKFKMKKCTILIKWQLRSRLWFLKSIKPISFFFWLGLFFSFPKNSLIFRAKINCLSFRHKAGIPDFIDAELNLCFYPLSNIFEKTPWQKEADDTRVAKRFYYIWKRLQMSINLFLR